MSEWPRVPLETLAAGEKSAISKPYGSAMMKDDYRDVGVPVVRGVNLSEGRFRDDDFVFIAAELACKMPGAILAPGDLVVTHRGTVGQVSMIPWSPRYEQYVASTSQVKVRLDTTRTVPEFLYYWFQSPDGQQTILERRSTVGVPGLVQPVATVKSLIVPNPPVAEQRAIAEVLGALDDKIAANRRVVLSGHDLARVIFLDRTRAVPVVTMSSALDSVLGGTPSRTNLAYWDGDIPWASAKDVAAADAGALINTTESITELAASSTKARPLPAGSVILTARGTVGAVARLGVDASFNQSCYGFKAEALPSAVLYLTVLDAVRQLKMMVHGSVFDTITRRAFEHVRVIDPAWAGVMMLNRLVAPLLDQTEQLVRENERLASTRDALLPLLMSGKVRVKDVEDQAGEMV